MNILILSVGTRNKIVQYFKRTIQNEGKIIATDMNELAPAVYEADAFYKVPCITDPKYIDIILDICEKEKISAILSLIDPELSLIAENKERFDEIGVKLINSSPKLCEMALDKMKMYHWLTSHGYKCAKSYISKEEFLSDVERGEASFPVFVKPVKGSASILINKVDDKESLDSLWHHADNLMIQEYIDGQEIGADCYVDMISGEVVSVFTKKKLLMRAGETDKAVSFKDEKLFALIEKFLLESGYSAQVDIDIFEVNGEYYFSEINPRFGGGYPHAHECGCDHIALIKNNLNGIANEKNIGQYSENVYMMKYNEISIKAGISK